MVFKSYLSSVSFQLRPTSGVRSTRKDTFTWVTTDNDPQFILKSTFRRTIQPGFYKVRVEFLEDSSRLSNAVFYLDTGKGFNEASRVPLEFKQEGAEIFCLVEVSRPVVRVRFDPSEGPNCVFSARSVSWHPLDDNEYQRLRAIKPMPLRTIKHRPGELNLLMNLHRLLPATEGAGGAGRLAFAYLRHLPKFCNLRVIIAPHNLDLLPLFNDVDFVVCETETHRDFESHLEWCDCYFDFLNGLRPTYIPDHVVVMASLLDLQHMRFPTFFSEAEFAARLKEYGYAIDRADQLIAISGYEKLNLEHFYSKNNVSVVPLSGFSAEDYLEKTGSTPLKRSRKKASPYIIYPAMPWAHKNHETLIQAVAYLKRTGNPVRLILTNVDTTRLLGTRLAELAESLDVLDCIEFKSFVTEPELIQLLQDSSGLVFPSLYEGFGIPLVDAMKLGVPVLVSDLGTTREICGDTVSYIQSPRNFVSLAQSISGFLQQDKEPFIVKARERARIYSSENMARGIVDAAKVAIKQKKTNLNHCSVSSPRQEDTFIASVLIFLPPNGVFFNLDSQGIAKVNEGFGDNVNVTFAVDFSSIKDTDAKRLNSVPNLILYDAEHSAGRKLAVQEFSRRHCNCRFHLITDWAQPEATDPRQLSILLAGLRQYPESNYAEPDVNTGNDFVRTARSEEETITMFESMRRGPAIVYNKLFRNTGPFRTLHQGTTQFLSAFCSEKDYIRVPREVPSNEK